MKLLISCFLAFLWPGLNTIAQEVPASDIRPLTVGDTVPDIVIENVINHPVSKIQLSELKGKIVILDFFATWCAPCIKELPRLDSLQRIFNENLQIIVVCYESQETVSKALQRSKLFSTIELPFSTSDTVLNKLFPHRLLPHDVWLNKAGKVSAITQASYINEKNITALKNGKSFSLPLKKDILDFRSNIPLLENGNGGETRDILYKSLLTRNLTGLFSGRLNIIDEDSIHRRWSFINKPILSLYAACMERPFTNRTVLEVSDPAKYIRPGDEWDRWAEENHYSYEVTVPLSTSEKTIKKHMRKDLSSFFSLSERVERRLVDCWVIVADSLVKKVSQATPGNGQTISTVLQKLNKQIPGQPIAPIIINESDYTGIIDLDAEAIDSKDMYRLIKALNIVGLNLLQVKRELELLILSETN